MKKLLVVSVLYSFLACAPFYALAAADIRQVADGIASSITKKHDDAKAALLQASTNLAFNDYFTVIDPAKKRAAKEVIEKLMLEVSSKYAAVEMCLIGAGGPELARVGGGKIASDLDPHETDNEFFGPAMAQKPKTAFISPPYISHDANKWVIAYATPIAFIGQTKAILHYEHGLETYQALLRQTDDPTAHVMLISADGYVLGDNRADITVGQKGENEKPEAYFKKFAMSGLDLDAVKNKLRGGAGRLGAGDKAVSVAWRALPAEMTLVVAQD